jgi:hypothetical protein
MKNRKELKKKYNPSIVNIALLSRYIYGDKFGFKSNYMNEEQMALVEDIEAYAKKKVTIFKNKISK